MKRSPFQVLHVMTLFALTAFGSSLLTSCQTEGCTDPMSDNFDPKAKVDDGSCVPWRDKFVATYLGTYACPENGPDEATVVITPSATSEEGLVISVSAAGVICTAKTSGRFEFEIPSQTILYKGEEVTIFGTGIIRNEKDLEIQYTLKSGPISITCQVVGAQL